MEQTNKQTILMTSSSRGKRYDKGINGMMKVLGQKQVDMLSNDFDKQKYINKMLMIVLDIVHKRNGKSFDDLMVRNFKDAVEDYRKADKNILITLFGQEGFDKMFGGDEE